MTTWRLITGDVFDVLPTMAAESIDACVTDPPYGIGFMGREWDTFKPGTGATRKLMHPREREAAKALVSDNPNVHGRHRSPALSPSQIDYDYSVAGLRGFQDWTARWATEVHRVLKPGAYIVVCGAPRSHHRMMCGLEDAGFVVRDCFAWLFGSGFPKNYNLGDGKGTALKPAHEPIAIAWKPFKGTIEKCHANHGTAALNIDACRLEGGKNVPASSSDAENNVYGKASPRRVDRSGMDPDVGRWPANVLLDEEAAAMLDEQTGELQGPGGPANVGTGSASWLGGGHPQGRLYCGEVGGASRFYYVAKPSRAERDAGTGRNIHPTVKPVDLMAWLVRLVTPIGGTVLDPFNGSGTTGMACIYEQRHYIGIEREAEYVAIARRRIASVAPMLSEELTA